ncbi:MAG: DUF1850 domain-containing protein [Deltaproteobacteria bacterium]|nr:DUF1850 domain-containing protein [Deltaproteobacteria bacterium]
MPAVLAALLLLAGSGPPSAAVPGPPSLTRVVLADGAAGRTLADHLLCEGEQAVLRWRNSLFGVDVTETFEARAGGLLLTGVTFALPGGGEPPRVRAEDVEDLYHTGGPFRAEGLARPVARVTFRVGEIGRPRFTLGGRTVAFADEVGFGGTVRLVASAAAATAASPACPARRS